jgi:hypothetical protein
MFWWCRYDMHRSVCGRRAITKPINHPSHEYLFAITNEWRTVHVEQINYKMFIGMLKLQFSEIKFTDFNLNLNFCRGWCRYLIIRLNCWLAPALPCYNCNEPKIVDAPTETTATKCCANNKLPTSHTFASQLWVTVLCKVSVYLSFCRLQAYKTLHLVCLCWSSEVIHWTIVLSLCITYSLEY